MLIFYVLTLIIFATIAGITSHLPYRDLLSIAGSAILIFLLTFLFVSIDRDRLRAASVIFNKESGFHFFAGIVAGKKNPK